MAGKKLISALEKLHGSPKFTVDQRYNSNLVESVAAESVAVKRGRQQNGSGI
jgi:hypothetical protein